MDGNSLALGDEARGSTVVGKRGGTLFSRIARAADPQRGRRGARRGRTRRSPSVRCHRRVSSVASSRSSLSPTSRNTSSTSAPKTEGDQRDSEHFPGRPTAQGGADRTSDNKRRGRSKCQDARAGRHRPKVSLRRAVERITPAGNESVATRDERQRPRQSDDGACEPYRVAPGAAVRRAICAAATGRRWKRAEPCSAAFSCSSLRTRRRSSRRSAGGGRRRALVEDRRAERLYRVVERRDDL